MEDEKIRRKREANAADSARKETVVQIPLADLHPFPNHPFKVREDESMKETTASVKEFGVFTPAIVRPCKEGGYEIISGHRRKRACELAGIKTMPAIVRNMDDNMAVIAMVDSNLQRENILPSERAWAYKMKLDAIKRQGARTDLTSPHVAARFRSDDEIARKEGVSGDTIRRYIRLTELSPLLQQMVDEKKIALTPAVEISYLKPEEQALLADAIESEQSAPSLSQAQRMRQLSKLGALDADMILTVMSEEKKPQQYDLTISGEKLRKYFPATSTPREMEETILKLLDAWQRNKRRDRGR
jgi:ParB family chromosome partitioning protein